MREAGKSFLEEAVCRMFLALYVSQYECHILELGEAQCTSGFGTLKNMQMHAQAEGSQPQQGTFSLCLTLAEHQYETPSHEAILWFLIFLKKPNKFLMNNNLSFSFLSS